VCTGSGLIYSRDVGCWHFVARRQSVAVVRCLAFRIDAVNVAIGAFQSRTNDRQRHPGGVGRLVTELMACRTLLTMSRRIATWKTFVPHSNLEDASATASVACGQEQEELLVGNSVQAIATVRQTMLRNSITNCVINSNSKRQIRPEGVRPPGGQGPQEVGRPKGVSK
jgi:hypothetical protein